ncbi:MAG: SOS response-associated peptidase [Myxococcales bacterium]|nr:SOS response-associated peptidase [Myxococcales bacterium]
MCGRYTLTRQDDVIEDLQASLGMLAESAWWKPRFNVAPTQPAPVVIRKDGTRTIELMRWGLVPHWAGKPGAKPPLMINARLEGLQDKPMFREALAHKRCLVPADGFFEWKRDPKQAKAKPQPIYLHPAPRRTVAFAGLWARSRTEAGEQLSFTIITGPPNELVRPIHDRMPVVLDPSAYAAWLDPTLDGEGARALLGIPPIGDWIAEPVSMRVNTAQADDPTLIEPIAVAEPAQRDLFD